MQPTGVSHLFLHHAAAVYPSGDEAMRRIQRFHQDSRGWADYAYNYGVWDDGSIWEGRGWGAQGGHTKGWNTKSVAICYMGDGSKPVPKAALDAILWLAGEADRHFGRELVRQGHRDVGSTSCPGDWLYRWWASEGSQRRSEPPSNVPTPEDTVVSSQGISERPSPIPNVRDGWRRHMARMGWLNRR
jgi:N-acetylmuramoyl-L-alanine amidase